VPSIPDTTLTSALPKTVRWDDGVLYLLDQTRLPLDEHIVQCCDIETVFESIQTLRVRGAPAIGVAAAYGLVVGLRGLVSVETMEQRARLLISARPTAVNLTWAINRVMEQARHLNQATVDVSLLETEAKLIHDEDIRACRKIGEIGLPIVKQHSRLLTHCNAGALAVSELGTALAPIYLAHQCGMKVHVYVDETRPLLQGARLTTYELTRNGVPNTLISDNMAAYVMSLGRIDAVIVGADRVAANGDVANKIGTLNLAILSSYFSIPFYVACPMSTIDRDTHTGDEIVIEERDASELRYLGKQQVTLSGVKTFNPAFDITPASLVTGLITDRGIVDYPDEVKLSKLGSG